MHVHEWTFGEHDMIMDYFEQEKQCFGNSHKLKVAWFQKHFKKNNSFALWMMSLMFWLHTTFNSSSMSSNSCPYKWDYHHPPRFFSKTMFFLTHITIAQKDAWNFSKTIYLIFPSIPLSRIFTLKSSTTCGTLVPENVYVYCYSCQECIKTYS